MRLDRRKERILFAVVEEYIRSALPVGSRTVVKKGVDASSATVRNEMGALEEQGLLEHPYTSAGRVPTAPGFRYYVDRLLEREWSAPMERDRLKNFYSPERMSSEDLIAETAQVLSGLSHIVGLIMIVPAERAPLKSVYFFEQGRDKIRVLFRMIGGTEEERVIANERGLDATALARLNILIEKVAAGRTLTGLRRELIRQMEEAREKADVLLARAIELSERLVMAEKPELFISGQTNLFDLPEFSEAGRIKDLLRTLEKKKLLVELLEGITLTSGVKVLIGEENDIETMRCCSVIASTYGRGEMTAGTLGVIGPTRLDYARLIPLVHYTSGLISEYLSRRD